MEHKQTFSFGRNWQTFLRNFDEERVKVAELSLVDFLNMPDLRGQSFLDVGCGSGLFSYAAFKLGAKSIVSFDLDPYSVECCKYLRDKADNPPHWKVLQGSDLD